MTEQNSSYRLNEFGSIDYRKPLGKQQDMRTSTYLGHKFIDDTMLGNKLQAKYNETRSYEKDYVLEKNKTTQYNSNYIWKFGNPDEVRNVSLQQNIHYIKPFYECNLKFLKRPMRPPSSVTHSDYLWQSGIASLPAERAYVPAAVPSTKIIIDRNKAGYSKYLDPSATITNLDYCYRCPQAIFGGIGAKDHITFWNWKDIEFHNKNVFRVKNAQLCDKLPSKECTKRHCEFPNRVQAVPNAGRTTEVRENYINPNKRSIAFADGHFKKDLTFVKSEPEIIKTEYNILGSGECVQKYV